MGFDWFKVSAKLREHEKSVRLAALLRDRRAWSWVVGLWMWCAESEGSGRIEGDEARAMVEFGAGWDGKPGVLAAALIKVGFVEEDGDALVVHDWAEWQEQHVARRAADRARQARHRAKKRRSVTPLVTPPVTRDSPRDITRDPSKENQREEILERSDEEEDLGASAPASSAAEGVGGEPPRIAPTSSAPEAPARPLPAREPPRRDFLQDDDIPKRKLDVVDRSHERGSELRRQVALRSKRTTALLPMRDDDELWDRLEAKLDRVRMERAVKACLSAGDAEPGGHESIRFFAWYANHVLALEDDLVVVDELEVLRAKCPLWADLVAKLPPGYRRDWLALEPEFNGQVLTLAAPTREHASMARSQAHEIAEGASELQGHNVQVNVVEKPRAAAGGVT